MPNTALNPIVPPHIGSLNEKPLHAALKAWYARPGDRVEAEVDGYLVDLVRGDMLVEIQTRSFASAKRKLLALTRDHAVRLVYPVPARKWIVRTDAGTKGTLGRRRSPKKGSIDEVFGELVSFPQLLADPNFSLEILLIHEEEVRYFDRRRGWRRKGWLTQERRLIEVVDRVLFERPREMLSLLPESLPEPFTTADLARSMERPRRLMQKMAYCLRGMGAIVQAGKCGNAICYARCA